MGRLTEGNRSTRVLSHWCALHGSAHVLRVLEMVCVGDGAWFPHESWEILRGWSLDISSLRFPKIEEKNPELILYLSLIFLSYKTECKICIKQPIYLFSYHCSAHHWVYPSYWDGLRLTSFTHNCTLIVAWDLALETALKILMLSNDTLLHFKCGSFIHIHSFIQSAGIYWVPIWCRASHYLAEDIASWVTSIDSQLPHPDDDTQVAAGDPSAHGRPTWKPVLRFHLWFFYPPDTHTQTQTHTPLRSWCSYLPFTHLKSESFIPSQKYPQKIKGCPNDVLGEVRQLREADREPWSILGSSDTGAWCKLPKETSGRGWHVLGSGSSSSLLRNHAHDIIVTPST